MHDRKFQDFFLFAFAHQLYLTVFPMRILKSKAIELLSYKLWIFILILYS